MLSLQTRGGVEKSRCPTQTARPELTDAKKLAEAASPLERLICRGGSLRPIVQAAQDLVREIADDARPLVQRLDSRLCPLKIGCVVLLNLLGNLHRGDFDTWIDGEIGHGNLSAGGVLTAG